MKFFKALPLAILLAFTFSQSFAQICATPGVDGSATISGSVNSYFPIQANTNLAAGAKSIVVSPVPATDPYGNNFGTVSIKAGDLILLIQMQDATINATNNNLYGSNNATVGPDGLGGTGFTNIGTTGNFEYVIATNAVPLTGGTLNFKGSGPGDGCVYSYVNADANGTRGQRTFQAIRVPQYSNLTLSSNINTPPFNGRGGGIIAFDVAGTMNFNGFTIDATARGFRGGYGPVAGSGASNSTTYMANSSSNLSVGKGESIAGTPKFMWDGFNQVTNPVEGLPGGSYGKGAPANGGGGGNDHNAGGGGGGNGGFGGEGGRGWEGGGGTYPNGGRPGYRSYLTATPDVARLIMGGGGGGGDANNATTGVKGGVGGGIVLINVARLLNTGTIRANGSDGAPGAFSGAPDGAGGGGAGGCIYVKVSSASVGAVLNLEARGGNGGNTLNDNGAEHGPGGGGGGGLIYHSAPSATINTNVARGVAGKTIGGTGTVHFAVDGTDGVIRAFTPSTDLPVFLQGGGSICYPEVTTTISEANPGAAGSRNPNTTATYTVTAINAATGGNAGEVRMEVQLPAGFTYQSATVAYTGAAGGPTTLTNLGTANLPYFGTFNISPGDRVIITLVAKIDATVTPGSYNASAQSTYLDPTRTSLDPNRRITAKTQAFAGANTNYEGGGSGNVPGANYNGSIGANPGEDVVIRALPIIGIAKRNTSITYVSDTQYDLTYRFRVENLGNLVLNNIQVPENLVPIFPAPSTFTVPGGSTVTGAGLVANAGYNGSSNANLLGAGSSLAVGASGEITIVVRLNPNDRFGPFVNQVTGTGTGSNGTVVNDVSTNGTTSDPNGDGNPSENTTTSITIPANARIGIAKSVAAPVVQPDGTYLVTYTFTVKNIGNTTLTGVAVNDDMVATYPAPNSYTITAGPTTTGSLTANTLFNGSSQQNLLNASSSLAPGQKETITLTVKVSLN